MKNVKKLIKLILIVFGLILLLSSMYHVDATVVRYGTVDDFVKKIPISDIYIDVMKVIGAADHKGGANQLNSKGFVRTGETGDSFNYKASTTSPLNSEADNELLSGHDEPQKGELWYVYKNVAILPDGTYADVRIIYSNHHIFTNNRYTCIGV